jgi:serine/threonine-protein kinase
MTYKPDGAIERIAGAIVDETPIDWDVELSATPDARSRLRHLQAIHRMALAYRAVESPPSRGDRREDVSPQRPPLFEWGHLHVLEKLGEGTYGEVYRAFDPRLARDVALKLWRRPGESERLVDEGRRLAKIKHPNVLTVHGAGEHDGRVGIWTDVIRGRTLEERLLAEGNLGAKEAASIGLDLCGALAAVHAAGLVHGDVKTTNVIREDGGKIVLLDFGSGGERPSDAPATPHDGPFGTPVALSPERLRGVPPDAPADLYALGVLLYRLVSGRYPVTARTIEELRSKHDRRERTPLRDVRPDMPAAFVRAVERALAHDAADRFASAGEMEQALAASIGMGARQDPAPRLEVAGDRPRRTGRRLLGLAGVLAVLGFPSRRRATAPRRSRSTRPSTAWMREPGAPSSTAAGSAPAISCIWSCRAARRFTSMC